MAKKGPMELSLLRALRAQRTQPADAAVVALALSYARALDAPRALMDVASGPMADLAGVATLHQLGGSYRQALENLGLTPKARSAVMRGAPQSAEPKASPLDELRAKREKRGTA